MGEYYGYSPQSNRILMAAEFGDHGAGPGNVAVSDMSILDLGTGEVTQIFPDNVVEAEWGPDGASFAYILATPASYELRWWTEDGEDRLLASDVSFTWSVAPSGQAVAFTRETGYELKAAPGLFVVTVADAREVMLSDADKGGVGSITDRPVWSPDSQEVIFSLWGGAETRVILGRADGSQAFDLGVDPSAADAWWSGLQIPGLLWYPDGDHVLVNSSASNPDAGAGGMGGATAIVVYRVDRAARQLADGRLVGEMMGLIGWNIPGESFWSIGHDGKPKSVALSAAP
jgi:Tol biopolymer transport system component